MEEFRYKLNYGLYMIMLDNGKLMRSGRNYTIAIYDNLGTAKQQLTRIGQGRIIVVKEYEELEEYEQ